MKRVSHAALFPLAILGSFAVFGQTPIPNPDLVQSCPYDIIFVLDESGSINGQQQGTSQIAPQIRNGSSALITSLNGTGCRVAVVEFNSDARRAIIGGSVSYQVINNNYVTAFNSYVNVDNNNNPNANQYDPEDCNGCFTNWEDALNTVATINATEDTADLVIFFTDGMPTAYINANGNIITGQTNAITTQALLDAIGAANAVKTQGSHIFVVGIPNPTLPEPNVQAISDPDRYPVPQPDFLKADYSVSTPASLQQDLANLVLALIPNTTHAGFGYQITSSNNCDSFMVQLTNTSTGASSYYWDFGDSTYSNDTSLVHLFNSGGPFVVMLRAEYGGVCGRNDTLYDTLSFVLQSDTLFSDFNPSFTPDCDSLLVQFAGTSSGDAIFSWNFGNGVTEVGDSAIVVYTTPGTYNVTLITTSTTGCTVPDTVVKPFTFTPLVYTAHADFNYNILSTNACDSFMVELTNTSTGASSYYWDFGDNTYSNDTGLVHLFSSGGPFVVMLQAEYGGVCGRNDTLYDTLSFTLQTDTLFSDFNPSFTPDCDSLRVQFAGTSSGNAIFSWDFGNGFTQVGDTAAAVYTTPGTYNVTLITTSTAGCTVPDTVVKPFTFTPLAYTAHADFDYHILYQNDCDTFVVQFTNQSTGGTSYYWDLGNGNISADTNATVTYTGGNYSVALQVDDSRKCSTNDTLMKPLVFTPVIHNPIADFTYAVSTDCDVTEVTLSNLSAGANGFEWRVNNSMISNEVAPNSALYYYRADSLAVQLVAEGINNCAVDDTASKSIVIPAPYGRAVADFGFTPSKPKTDEVVQFTNLSKQADSTLYQWDFGDGNVSNEINPKHVYADKGNYQVCLYADNGYDCPSTACKDLPVIYIPIVDLPTAFTPNGDDRNDVFIVRGKDINKIDLKIFNRWGELVFESKDPTVGWDGTYKGQPQETEVYDWLLNATLKNGQELFKKGNVTLLR